MELEILERKVKYREERESRDATKYILESKTTYVGTSLDLDKGKAPMGEIPQIYVEQQVKYYLQTSEQIKKKLNMMTSTLDTQEVATSQITAISQITTVVEKNQPEQNQVEEKPLKKINISIRVPTIDLTNSEDEEEIISPVPVTVETGNDFQNFTSGNNGKLSSPLP